jgi:hypothetical protein
MMVRYKLRVENDFGNALRGDRRKLGRRENPRASKQDQSGDRAR